MSMRIFLSAIKPKSKNDIKIFVFVLLSVLFLCEKLSLFEKLSHLEDYRNGR